MDLQELTYRASELLFLLKRAEEDTVRIKEVKSILHEGLTALGLHEIVTQSGQRIKIETVVHAAIPKDKRSEACEWLRSNGHQAIVKNTVACTFGVKEDASATNAAGVLKAAGFNPTQEQTVHHMTLTSLVKELMAEGIEIPHDLLGVVTVDTVKVHGLTWRSVPL